MIRMMFPPTEFEIKVLMGMRDTGPTRLMFASEFALRFLGTSTASCARAHMGRLRKKGLLLYSSDRNGYCISGRGRRVLASVESSGGFGD